MAGRASRRRTSTGWRSAPRTFDRHYVGSRCPACRRGATCMTGRLTFLHRSWGPLEPFDNAFPELLRAAGVIQPPRHRPLPLLGGRRRDLPQPLRHLRVRARAGGRPVEGDGAAAVGAAAREVPRAPVRPSGGADLRTRRTSINREFIREEKDFPSVQCLRAGARLPRARTATPTTGCCRSRPSIRTSRSTRRRASGSRSAPAGTGRSATGRATAGVDELPEECEELRANYYALMALCDDLLGKILDDFDAPRPVEGHRARS